MEKKNLDLLRAIGKDADIANHELIAEAVKEIDRLQELAFNMKSTIEAWDHAEIMKCGCKYSSVWESQKWEHWLVPCKQHMSVMAKISPEKGDQ